MKRLIFSLFFIILTYNLAFSEDILLNKPSSLNCQELYMDEIKQMEVKLGNKLILDRLNKDKRDSSSKSKAGKILIYAGAGVAIIGINLIIMSVQSVTAPTYRGGYFGTKTVREWEHLKVPGFVLLGAGVGMMVWGYFLRKSDEKERSSIILSINPLEAKAEISYRINF